MTRLGVPGRTKGPLEVRAHGRECEPTYVSLQPYSATRVQAWKFPFLKDWAFARNTVKGESWPGS